MNEDSKKLLEEIGRQLDRRIFPIVKNGGYVAPSGTTVSLKPLGTEKQDERERQAGSTTQSWTGAARGQGSPGEPGATGRSWPTGEASQVFSADVCTAYQDSLSLVGKAYPGLRNWDQKGGFWLQTESSILPGLGRMACFLTCVATAKRTLKSWAFWKGGVIGTTWIGPRHTNFPDGSICAFEPKDGTWAFGDPLIELLDIYTVWALRHLHLEVFGRWPGPQAVVQPYERILEFRDDELCGCGNSGRRYADCCKKADLRVNRIAEAIRFCEFSNWNIRHRQCRFSGLSENLLFSHQTFQRCFYSILVKRVSG